MTTEERDDAATAAIAAAVIGAVFSVAALALSGGKAALSVAIGAVIAVMNLLTMRAIVRALVRPPETAEDSATEGSDADATPEGPGRAGVAWGIFGLVKILVLFGLIFLLLTRGWVDPIALVVGYGVLPLGIGASALLPYLSPRRRP